jgi:hypothetical protein
LITSSGNKGFDTESDITSFTVFFNESLTIQRININEGSNVYKFKIILKTSSEDKVGDEEELVNIIIK